MARSKISAPEFRREAWRGVNHLVSHFGVSRAAIISFAERSGIKIPYVKQSIDHVGRADDELVLAAIRLRRRGKKPQEFGPIIGVSGDKLLSIYRQTIAVRYADVKESGEPAARIMKEYW